ncbi:MAG: cell division protein FtsH [Capnocytophaga ochracea]
MNTFISNISDNSEPYVKVSEAELLFIDEGLEEAKEGVFISHNEVMKGLRELIENWKNGRSNDYLVAKS